MFSCAPRRFANQPPILGLAAAAHARERLTHVTVEAVPYARSSERPASRTGPKELHTLGLKVGAIDRVELSRNPDFSAPTASALRPGKRCRTRRTPLSLLS